MSGDPAARQEDFRLSLGAEFSFVSDGSSELMKRYGVKLPLIGVARRTTVVVGGSRRILRILRGGEARDAAAAAGACPIR